MTAARKHFPTRAERDRALRTSVGYRQPAPVDLPPTSFGHMLREFRVLAVLSQNEAARRSGIDPAYWNRMERGQCSETWQPQRTIVLSIAHVLDLSARETDELLFAAGLATARNWQAEAARLQAQLDAVTVAFRSLAAVIEPPRDGKA